MTICIARRKPVFEKYPLLRDIVQIRWEEIPNRYEGISLDEYVIMPDHIHGIIKINPAVGAGFTPAFCADQEQTTENQDFNGSHLFPEKAGARPATTLGDIVGTFKSLCLRDWLNYIKENKLDISAKFWQRGFYDHVIRDDSDLKQIQEYIRNNPLKLNRYFEEFIK